MKFRKRPVVIEAKRLTTDSVEEILEWVDVHAGTSLDGLYITTLEGEIHASWGDYIIQGIQGEFYPCKPDIFEATYEEVTDGV